MGVHACQTYCLPASESLFVSWSPPQGSLNSCCIRPSYVNDEHKQHSHVKELERSRGLQQSIESSTENGTDPGLARKQQWILEEAEVEEEEEPDGDGDGDEEEGEDDIASIDRRSNLSITGHRKLSEYGIGPPHARRNGIVSLNRRCNHNLSITSCRKSSEQGIGPPHALVASLKACAQQKDLHTGSRIHADIVRTGLLEHNPFLGSTLISMYAKCGALGNAQEVFNNLLARNVVTWNALITGYAQHGDGKRALNCYRQMQLEGPSPDVVTFASILKACGSIGAADKGQQIHADIVREGLLEKGVVVGTALVDMYAKCGLLVRAQHMCEKLPIRDVASWNALITGYVQHGHGVQALRCFEEMQREGLAPNAVTFVCILKACASVGNPKKGQEVHADIIREGLLENNVVLGTALVDMYAKCGMLLEAQEVFDMLPARNIVSWNALIAGYAQHGHGEHALKSFRQMKLEGFSPNTITFVCILKACGSAGAANEGQEIHAEILKEAGLEEDMIVGTALVDMYAKCGLLVKAQEIFNKLRVRDVVLWSALVAGYAQHGHGEQALRCFDQMQLEGHSPNTVTYMSALKACGSIGAAVKGQEIHAEIAREGLLEEDAALGIALVDMYAKCGQLVKAKEVFDKLPIRSVVLWSVLIAGYAEHGHGEEALMCFEQMQNEGLSPDAIVFACVLKACGSIGAAEQGQEIHDVIVRDGWMEKDTAVGTALVDMYAKCGLVAKAQDVFGNLSVRDVVSWSALMAGYSLLGKAEHVFYSFDKMVGEGIRPNLVTFTIVLNACSHSGLLDKGWMYFESMSRVYGIIPTLEHHICIVDLFARAGYLEKAVGVIREMPFSANLLVWRILLGACRKWGNMKLGRLAFENVVRLDNKDAAAYVCMSNIYACAGRQVDAEKVEAMRVKNQAWIILGHCWWNDASG